VRLAPLVLVVPLLAACGGAAKTTHTTSATSDSSARDFVTAANKVCVASDRRIFRIGRLTRDPKGWAKTYASAKIAVTAMMRIVPPAARADTFKRMLRYARALTLSIQEIRDALRKNDIATAAAAQLAAGQLQDEVHRSAKAAGLTFCQQPLTNWPA
jgi:hypothetical protein